VSAVGLVAVVVLVFFAIGIAVGVIGVIALGAVRRQKPGNRVRGTYTTPPGTGPRETDPRDEEDDGPPPWPGR
jgi:hypothetical protein